LQYVLLLVVVLWLLFWLSTSHPRKKGYAKACQRQKRL
jgi:hypothetical protein